MTTEFCDYCETDVEGGLNREGRCDFCAESAWNSYNESQYGGNGIFAGSH